MRRLLVLLILLGAIPARAEPQWTVDGLRIGMTRAQVVAVLGPPDWEDETVDWEGDPFLTMRYFRGKPPEVPGASARRDENVIVISLDGDQIVTDVNGLTVQKDGRVVVRVGDRRQDVLSALGPPTKHEPELQGNGQTRIGDDTWPQVRVRYSGGRVFEVALSGECRIHRHPKPEDDAPAVRAWREALGEVAWELPKAERRRLLARAMEMARALDPEGLEVAETHYALAGAQEDPRSEAAEWEVAFRLFRRHLHDRHGQLVNVLANLAGAYERFDREKALEARRQALAIARRRDADSAETAYALRDLVELLRDMGRKEEAEALAGEAGPVWEKHGMTEERPFGYGSTSFGVSGTAVVSGSAPAWQPVHGMPYSLLLANPILLPVQESGDWYAAALALLRARMSDLPSEEALLAGARAELEQALHAAERDPAPLARVTRPETLVQEAWRLYPDLEPRILTWAAASGLLRVTGTPLTAEPRPLTRETIEALQSGQERVAVEMRSVPPEAMAPGGIGYRAAPHPDGGLELGAPLDSPLPGLQPGDRITAVDGVAITGVDWLEAEQRTGGPVGSEVTLSLTRGGVPQTVRVRRREVSRGWPRTEELGGGVIRLRIDNGLVLPFVSLEELAIRDGSGELRGVVVDLRGCRGGMGYDEGSSSTDTRPPLERSGDLLGPLLGPDAVVGLREGQPVRAGQPSMELRAPLVVLIDARTEGIAEVVAASMQFRGVPVVGQPSAGQTMLWEDLPVPGYPDLGVRMPVTPVFGPGGADLRQGVRPDHLVEMESRFVGDPEHDVQLKRTLEVLKTRSTAGASPGNCRAGSARTSQW